MTTETKISISAINGLLSNVQTLVNQQKELERVKGEKFNVFSILKMETKENKLHSAFLAELLNPRGSHLQGHKFLSLFFQQIGVVEFDLNSAKVLLEYNIGNRNDIHKTGGRIDILIHDNQGHYISIENKIYAGDQHQQIERYCNYRKDSNKVFYLTLWGTKPSEESKGRLKEGGDFNLISYRNDISEWLNQCLQHSVDLPILRESIKQYLIIIKKLTGQMDTQLKNDLYKSISQHIEEARYISKNYKNTITEIGEKIRFDVLEILRDKLGNDYDFQIGNEVNDTYAQIWIRIQQFIEKPLFFGVETFNGDGNGSGDIFIGIFNHTGDKTFFDNYQEFSNKNRYWANTENIPNFENCSINIAAPETIKRLYNDELFYNGFTKHIAEYVANYIKNQSDILIKYFKREQL